MSLFELKYANARCIFSLRSFFEKRSAHAQVTIYYYCILAMKF